MNTLYHHGIKGQKWGVRRFQNKDGTLTAAGQKRLAKQADKQVGAAYRKTAKSYGDAISARENRDYFHHKYKKAKTEKAAKKWADKAIAWDKKFQDLDKEYYKNVVETSDLMKSISSNSNFVTYNTRRSVSVNSSVRGGVTREVGYDRKRVLSNTSKNQKRASRRNKKWKDYTIVDAYFY